MPAAVVVVHDEADTCEAILRALSEAGFDAVGFTNPIGALDAVEKDGELRVLVTRMSFGPGKLNGLALFRMLEHKRPARSGLRAVFIGRADYRQDAEQDGAFLLRGAKPYVVVEAVRKQMKPDGAAPLRVATGPTLWEGAAPAMAPPAPVPVTAFTPRTRQLLEDARWAINRSAAVQRWQMPVQRCFTLWAGEPHASYSCRCPR